MQKSHRLEIRLSAFEKKYIRMQAKECGLSSSDFVRKSVLNQEVKQRFTEEELEGLKDIRRIAQALQNMNNLFKHHKDFALMEENKKMLEELKKVIIKW